LGQDVSPAETFGVRWDEYSTIAEDGVAVSDVR
jgi:hypothetical protein